MESLSGSDKTLALYDDSSSSHSDWNFQKFKANYSRNTNTNTSRRMLRKRKFYQYIDCQDDEDDDEDDDIKINSNSSLKRRRSSVSSIRSLTSRTAKMTTISRSCSPSPTKPISTSHRSKPNRSKATQPTSLFTSQSPLDVHPGFVLHRELFDSSQ